MSASTARRPRDRITGTGTKPYSLKPSKPITPISHSTAKTTSCGSDYRSSSNGKENLRPTVSKAPAMAQKPIIRAVPRIYKTSAVLANDGETLVRKSTSSVPRGRSSSPSEFTRCLSDVRRDRRVSGSRTEKGPVGDKDRVVLSGGKGLSGVVGAENGPLRGPNGCRIYRDFKENGKIGASMDRKSGISKEMKLDLTEKEGKFSGVRVLGKGNGEVGMISNLIKANEVIGSRNLESQKNDRGLIFEVKMQKGVEARKGLKKEEPCFVSRSDNAILTVSNDGKSMVISNEKKGLSDEGSCGKYPSKLHEKLAFLEGKVKRIASDIKKTKEMLDMSNPDSSKVILSDIQDKISGIEKAMVQVTSESDSKSGSSKGNREAAKVIGGGQNMEADNSVKASVKGLNTDELEARFFPHHKLIKNRASVKTSSESSHSQELHVVEEPSCEIKYENLSLSSVDENPIALEFLASLNMEQKKVMTRNRQFGEVQETDGNAPEGKQDDSNTLHEKQEVEISLATDETVDDIDYQDYKKEEAMICEELAEDPCLYQFNEIGFKSSTCGWFISEGEAVLLAHDDGSCSFYDITNCEEKAEYKPPIGVPPNVWRDSWIIRAPGADGCSGRYVVAASAGNAMDSGFCSWDFYSKEVSAFHLEGGLTSSRAALAPLSNNTLQRHTTSCNILVPETQQWWYKPCGLLIVSTATCQKGMKIFDIRDGEEVMNWQVQKPVVTMDYSSPLQWRNRAKVVLAEADSISLWDVSSLIPQRLQSVSYSGRKISALHINNTDGELGGGVRQRVSSSEAEGNDGVFCTSDYINIIDFRNPSGIGLKIPKAGINVQSIYSRGDSIFLGCSDARTGSKLPSSQVQQFSIRKQRIVSTYALPESHAHTQHMAITQVWGNSNLVMAISRLGLSVFDALKDETGCQVSSNVDYGCSQNGKEVIGQDDLYCPSFDFSASRVLLISKDRPAMWRHLNCGP